MSPLWSLGLSAMGCVIFVLLAQKRWQGWALGIANQALWFGYAVATHQWGFFIGCALYGGSYVYGLRRWLREQRAEQRLWGQTLTYQDIVDAIDDMSGVPEVSRGVPEIIVHPMVPKDRIYILNPDYVQLFPAPSPFDWSVD